MAVHPATNGRRLAEPLVPAACSSRPLAEASPRRLLAAAGRRHRSLRPRHAPPPLEPQRPSSDCRGNGDGKRGRPTTAARGRAEVDAARAQRRANGAAARRRAAPKQWPRSAAHAAEGGRQAQSPFAAVRPRSAAVQPRFAAVWLRSAPGKTIFAPG